MMTVFVNVTSDFVKIAGICGLTVLFASCSSVGVNNSNKSDINPEALKILDTPKKKLIDINDFIHPDIAVDYCANSEFDKSQVLEYVNNIRTKGVQCGGKYFRPVSKLSWNSRLELAAKRHSNDMAVNQFLDHRGSNGSLPDDRIKDAGYIGYRVVTENVASGTTSLASTIETFVANEYHCANLMNPKVKEIGMACSYNKDSLQAIFWTQVFAVK